MKIIQTGNEMSAFCHQDGGRRFFWEVSIFLPDQSASHLKTWHSSQNL